MYACRIKDRVKDQMRMRKIKGMGLNPRPLLMKQDKRFVEIYEVV